MDFLKLVMGSTEIEAAPPLSGGASLLIRTVVVDSAGAACAFFGWPCWTSGISATNHRASVGARMRQGVGDPRGQ
jgi:hypothetical protein